MDKFQRWLKNEIKNMQCMAKKWSSDDNYSNEQVIALEAQITQSKHILWIYEKFNNLESDNKG